MLTFVKTLREVVSKSFDGPVVEVLQMTDAIPEEHHSPYVYPPEGPEGTQGPEGYAGIVMETSPEGHVTMKVKGPELTLSGKDIYSPFLYVDAGVTQPKFPDMTSDAIEKLVDKHLQAKLAPLFKELSKILLGGS